MTNWETRSWPAWWRRTRSLVALAVVTVAVVAASPDGGWTGSRLAVLVSCLPVSVACWLTWLFAPTVSRLAEYAVVVGTATGVALAVVAPQSAALVYAAAAVATAAVRLTPRWSLRHPAMGTAVPVVLALLASAGYVIGRAATEKLTGWVLVGPAAFTAALLLGLIRRQSDRLAVESELAREEQARAAALSERAHLAREIHDVLAHALSALAVALETTDALLEAGRTEQARRSVSRASQLAREGIAETRRAIGTLRGETLPLKDMLDGLAVGYRTDLGATATVRVRGEPRELDPEAALALYRTAQEAMTNVRKHAPGASVALDLRYEPRDVNLRVANGPAPAGAAPALVGSGGGYGLTGLRERAELAGGRFEAGPNESGYRVEISIAG